jgi:hypothetical protein
MNMKKGFTTKSMIFFLMSALLIAPAVWADPQITFRLVADENTPIPEGSENFSDFGSTPSISGKNVAFFGFVRSGREGIYKEIIEKFGKRKLRVVADTDTLIPDGSGKFILFGSPSISGENVAFRGIGDESQRGIYKEIAENFGKRTLKLVADKNTPIPEGSGNFTLSFSGISISGKNVAFRERATPSDQAGIYKEVSTFFGTDLRVVADTTTPIPDGSGNFADFGSTSSISGKSVAFDGRNDSGQRGIYTDIGGELIKVIAIGDELDGLTVTSVASIGTNGLSGNRIVFRVEFMDESRAIYVATVKEGKKRRF